MANISSNNLAGDQILAQRNRDPPNNLPETRIAQPARISSSSREIITPSGGNHREEPLVHQERARIPPRRIQAIPNIMERFFADAEAALVNHHLIANGNILF